MDGHRDYWYRLGVPMVDGEEQLFAKDHPIWKAILLLSVGLLLLGGLDVSDILVSALGV